MPEERTCDYTGQPIEPGTGIMYVAADGSILHFVDSKAEKNYFMGREARDLPWTEAGRAQAAARSPDEEPDTPAEAELDATPVETPEDDEPAATSPDEDRDDVEPAGDDADDAADEAETEAEADDGDPDEPADAEAEPNEAS